MGERGGKAPSVSVDRVSVRLPGPPGARAASADFGRRVTTRAVAMLADRLPAGASADIARIKLRVSVRSTTEAAMSEAIADALARAMSRRA
jgi:hypothetical protein